MASFMSDLAGFQKQSADLQSQQLENQYAPKRYEQEQEARQIGIDTAKRKETDILGFADAYSKISSDRLAANAALEKKYADEARLADEKEKSVGGYETPEMEKEAVVKRDFASKARELAKAGQQLKMDHDDLLKRSTVADKAHDPVTAKELREEAEGVYSKAQDTAARLLKFEQLNKEESARVGSEYNANPTQEAWTKFVQDQMTSNKLTQEQAMKLYSTPEAGRKAAADAAIEGAIGASERTKRYNVDRQVKSKEKIADATNEIKNARLLSEDRLRTAEIDYKKIQGTGIQGKMLIDAQKTLINSTKVAQDGLNKEVNQSDSKIKSLQASLKVAMDVMTTFPSKEDRKDAVDMLTSEIESERQNGDKLRGSFAKNVDEFKTVLASNPSKDVKELAEKSIKESVLREVSDTPETPHPKAVVPSHPQGILPAGTSFEQAAIWARQAIKDTPQFSNEIKANFKTETGHDLEAIGKVEAKPVESKVLPKPAAKPVAKVPEMSADDKMLMAALNKTSVIEDVSDFAKSAGGKLAQSAKGGFGLKAKQEAEWASYDKLSKYAKSKMEDKSFTDKLSDKQKAKLKEISTTTGAAKRKELEESDSPYDLLSPMAGLATTASKLGGKVVATKPIEKATERIVPEFEASLKKLASNFEVKKGTDKILASEKFAKEAFDKGVVASKAIEKEAKAVESRVANWEKYEESLKNKARAERNADGKVSSATAKAQKEARSSALEEATKAKQLRRAISNITRQSQSKVRLERLLKQSGFD